MTSRYVAELSQPRRFAAGEIVFREGDESNTCYVVRSGHARAVREHGGRAPDRARDVRPRGHLRRARDVRRRAPLGHVETTDALEVLAILGPDMRRLMQQRPALAVALAASLARRLRTTNERLASQSFQTVQSRVASVIAQLVEQAQAEGAPAKDVPITATQAELAMLAGSSRESASRFLATLERAGVISQGRGRLTVHDPDALRNYVY